MKNFIKGMDVSTLPELRGLGARFFDEGKEDDVLAILKRYGADSLRIRLWNDPYSPDGKPYSAGTNDLEKLMMLAGRIPVNSILPRHGRAAAWKSWRSMCMIIPSRF